MRNSRFWIGLSLFNALTLVFVLSPIAIVVVSSFGETEYLRFPPQGFTLRWYAQSLTDGAYIRTARTSLYVGLLAAAIAVLAGVTAAWALARYRLPGRAFLEGLFLSPLMLPHLILGVAIIVVTQPTSLSTSIWRLIAAHVVITVPYVIRVLLPVIAKLDPRLEEAAADLGATPSVTLRTVILPALLQSIAVGFIVAFMVSFDELILGLFLAPVTAQTLPMRIFANVEFDLDPTVGAVSTLLILFTVLLMVAIAVINRFRS